MRWPELRRRLVAAVTGSGGRDDDDDTEASILASVVASPVLLIDDLGVGGATEYTREIAWRILDARCNRRGSLTIITTNLAPGDRLWLAQIGDRGVSRLRGLCGRWTVGIDGPDHRVTPVS
ncbi:MAG: hypothetical protein AAF721_01610 [Myxococcota bacterium]